MDGISIAAAQKGIKIEPLIPLHTRDIIKRIIIPPHGNDCPFYKKINNKAFLKDDLDFQVKFTQISKIN